MERLSEVLSLFVGLLAERLEHGIHTTEDSVRYLFFHACMGKGGVTPNMLTLEEPLPIQVAGETNQRVDSVVYDTQGRRSLALEFKYHRVGKTSQPAPQNAGDLFSDVFRLGSLNAAWSCPGCFVYLTDAGMGNYLKQPRHGLQPFFMLGPGEVLPVSETILSGRSATFLKRAGMPRSCVVTGLANEKMPADHHLRVYRVDGG
jgi:hypothetical protein